MVLSSKAKDNNIFILDELKLEKIKTKAMNDILTKFTLHLFSADSINSGIKGAKSKKGAGFIKKGAGLIVLSEKNDNLIKSARNIDKAGVMQAKDLNVLDLLNYKYLIMPKESIKVIKDTFLK